MQPSSIQPSSMQPSSLRCAWLALAAMVATLAFTALARAQSTLDDAAIAQKLLGQWQSEFNGRPFTLDLDGSRTNPGGAIKGNATYNVRGGALITVFQGAIVAYDVSFPADDETLWVQRATGREVRYRRPRESDRGLWQSVADGFNRFTRGIANDMRPVPETSSEFIGKLQGYWRGGRGSEAYQLHLAAVDLTLVGEDTLQSPYLLMGENISFTTRQGIRSYRVVFESADRMVWISRNDQQRIRFERSAPFSVEAAELLRLLKP